MQRPSSPPATVAVVGVSTLTGGAALAAGDGPLSDTPGFALPIVCLTAAMAGVIRRCAVRHESRLRAFFADQTRRLSERERALDEREADLLRREESFRRTAWVQDLRIASVHARLDILVEEIQQERERRKEIEAEYAALAHEHNEVLLESAGVAREQEVHHPPVAVGQTSTADGRGPRRGSHRRGPRPFLKVVDRPRGHQESI
ncbi:hypothetical protein ACFYSF_22930 [Streptomyces canus]|uniref:hypothetical protein n=1 Tax=Streptomyces canus TaxID=58343 RepID=UPI003683BD43